MPADPAVTPLGIVAGRGDLPARLAEQALAQGRPVFVLALTGQADPATIAPYPHAWVRLADGTAALKHLRGAGVEELVFAGAVKRPSLLSLRPDRRAATFLAKVGWRALGDDSLLSAIVAEFEAEGFHVVGADAVWGDGRMPAGALTRARPDAAAWRDIRRGVAVVQALGAVDVGQGCVVQQGIVLAVEAVEGTDAMLARARDLRRDGPGGVLVKLAKPGQDRRIDLPTVGPDTVDLAIRAGLRGLAVEAGGALVLERDALAATADAAGLFVYGIDPARVLAETPDPADDAD
ncbi:MAG: UDP-2,3-diacylglucosamine diphosphatase LpxI [Alphaproteobacteria bacterium]|nr:UDP-2,3-diacylglucosamine diphosphatase LpxI [Alphaproteobacteria bacterium]MCB9930075.1 UDP-2,3-diacylglucosamine diphosphatase LpxI [Alphaproteobacteria bacterium]